MSDAGYLIIDDVHASLSCMSDLGRNVAKPSIEVIRDAVLEYAARRKWFALRHQSFVEWASELIRREERGWLVLDPLFPVAGLGPRVQALRLTRQFDENETVVIRRYSPGSATELDAFANVAGDVGVVDDAAASGTTLRQVARLVARAGANVARVLLSASSRDAREVFRSSIRMGAWTEFVRGDWQVVHLRDGCPHLPYSGRPTDQPPIVGTNGTIVEARVPSSSVVGNLWQVLCMDPKVRETVAAARSEIVRKLSTALGRPARVRDLGLLGTHVPALVRPGETVSGDSALESFLDSSAAK